MSNVLVEESSLQDIADSIRAKNGTANTYKPAEMSGAIDALPTGGGTMQSKSVSYTPTETAQSGTVTPDVGYDGLSSVSVSVGAIDDEYVGSGITRRSIADLDLTGATFTAPAGYYASDADKTMMTGHMSVSATKGTVSNHSVSVTPKAAVDNAGYFATGDRTGTAVSVSASELVSGTKSITQNGTGIDVTEYAAVDVAVSGGSMPPYYLSDIASSNVIIRGNHVKLDPKATSGNRYINLRTLSFVSSAGTTLSSPEWFSISAGDVVDIEYTNVVNPGNKAWNANIKKANSSTSLGYGIGDDAHLSGASVHVTATANESWGTLFVYVASFAGSVIEFDVTIKINGVRYL